MRPRRRPSVPRPAVLALGLLLGLQGLGGHVGCDGGAPTPIVTIDSPVHGAFVDASSVLVTGHVNAFHSSLIVTLNGAPVTLFTNGTWSATVPLDLAKVANPIEAVVTVGLTGASHRQRIVVLAGPSIADGARSPAGVGMRFQDVGLDAVEPLVAGLAGGALDIGPLIVSQNPVLDDQCVVDSGLGCLYWATANVLEAGFTSFGLDVDAQGPGAVATNIGIQGFYVTIDLHVRDAVVTSFDCRLEISASTANIGSQFDLAPDAAQPSRVDVRQVGAPSLTLGGFQYQFISGVCDAPVLGDIIDAFIGGSLSNLVAGGFQTALGDPDGAGPLDSPIADGIEVALGDISIAGAVGAALGLHLDAPFFAITEDAAGITFGADAGFTSQAGTNPGQCQPPPTAPDLLASYHVPGAFPALGATTPGGQPYALALTISPSAFNQLLKASVECGLLSSEITEIDLGFGGGPVALTSTALSLFIPEFAATPGLGRPMRLRLLPTTAPLVTGNLGPNGEMAELVIAQLLVEIVDDANTVWLRVAADARVGFGLGFDAQAGQLTPSISAPGLDQITMRVVDNAVGTNTAQVESILPLLMAPLFPSLSGTLGSFPLPTFFGLALAPISLDRTGSAWTLFADLSPVPVARIQNVQFTDLSTADFVVDSAFDVREWRHRSSITSSATAIASKFQGVIGADACCTVDDESASATARYRVIFDVAPVADETWRLAIDHRILGAFTLLDESNLVGDGGGQASITAVSASWTRSGGGSGTFGFTPSPTSRTHTINGNEGDSNVQFTGANGAVIQGTGPATVTLEFSFGLHAFSNSNVAFPAINGDEAAVRFGQNDSISQGFTAGEYPGPGNRNISQDGHFVDVTLESFPALP